ncbi:MAG TPA: DUF1002 domain-containing protein [Syntrophomonadaceae bacterium]|nr:DUF1002 domain-containing protein [Syntrophomonadaceae bacterium]
MKKGRRLALLLLFLAAAAGLVYARGQVRSTALSPSTNLVVITLGQDLNPQEKQATLSYFKGMEGKSQVRYLQVSNQEERDTLAGLVDESLIGSRAISSAYVEMLGKDKGLEVQTDNITAITPLMYASALTTAGIADARIIAAAPFPVSGTAALTGIIKAFESAQGVSLPPNAKDAAEREIAEAAKLGKKVGPQQAQKIIYEVKRQVIEKKVSDPVQIRVIILDVSARLNVQLSEEDVEALTQLMQRVASLNIDVKFLNDQLRGLDRNLKEVSGAGRQISQFLNQLMILLQSWLQGLRNTWS